MGTLTNQEFLYRETPVNYDGTGTLTSIKGNTVSFNQLVQNGNFADTSNWSVSGSGGVAFTVSDNIASVKCLANDSYRSIIQTIPEIPAGHKIFLSCDTRADKNLSWDSSRFFFAKEYASKTPYIPVIYSTSWVHNASIISFNDVVDRINILYTTPATPWEAEDKIYCRNVQIFDLTLMGIDNLTTTAEVEAWLSSHIGDLPYFDYTQGTLISFNGTGLKTVGFNQWDEVWENGILNINNGNKVSIANYIRSKNYIEVIPNKTYYLNFPQSDGGICLYDGNYNFVRGMYYVGVSGKLLTIASNERYIMFYNKNATYGNDICINISDTSKNGAYEPYTESTLSLSALTYFPSGIKSIVFSKNETIENVIYPCNFNYYDELLANKKKLLIGEYTFTGNETWAVSNNSYYANIGLSSIAVLPQTGSGIAPILHDFLEPTSANALYFGNKTSGIALYSNGNVYISSATYANISSLTGTKLYYVLQTPTETDISLDLTYPVWNNGTEQILPINDSTPDTAPILCDIDYRGLIPVNATVDPNGSGTVDGTGNYRYHSIATLEATPSDEIYRFLRWEDENGDTVSTNSVFSFEVGE